MLNQIERYFLAQNISTVFSMMESIIPDYLLADYVRERIVPKLSRTPGGIRFPGSTKVGQHNEEVYGSLLQMTKEQLEQLESRGIV